MKQNVQRSVNCNSVYGLGVIGALVYFISTSTSFLSGLIGVFKALVWPAFLVYEALKMMAV